MVAGHLLPQIQILFCREEDIHWCRPVGGFVRTADPRGGRNECRLTIQSGRAFGAIAVMSNGFGPAKRP